MALLVNHLEQIDLTTKTIGELEFASAKPFTNALLHNKEITALIRDPEAHEQGLFSVQAFAQDEQDYMRQRSYGLFHASSNNANRSNRRHRDSAVARVLGAEMLTRIQQSDRQNHRGRGVDVELLLQGAEKLCAAYNVPGTMDRVETLRSKHMAVSASVARYEAKVAEQQTSLKTYNLGVSQEDHEHEAAGRYNDPADGLQPMSNDFDPEAEEQMIKELEARKKALEAKLMILEKDLGGFL